MPNLSPAILALGASILLTACGQQSEDAAATLIDKASATACEAVDLGGNATEVVADTAAQVAVHQGLVDQGQASEVTALAAGRFLVHVVAPSLPESIPLQVRVLIAC